MSDYESPTIENVGGDHDGAPATLGIPFYFVLVALSHTALVATNAVVAIAIALVAAAVRVVRPDEPAPEP